jgi:adenylate cyclase
VTGERVERRLAAVLAADVAGYSRLMGIDEEGTLARLKAVRRDLVDPTLASHRGRIVKTTGDGVLVEFASAVDAARSAIEVQRGMADRNANGPQDARLEFRIGIHVGDIIIDENDIFGDGVNIAARLEGIAEPGGICISDDAQRQIRGKIDIAFGDMGPQVLKNIVEPMRSWRLLLDENTPAKGSEKPSSETALLTLPDKPSIAVLPFQNMSGDPEQEYFADGVVEDILTMLSRFKSLFVVARNSSFTYKGKAVDVRQVGRELGVRYVLEGSVRKAGGRVRITGQLVEAATSAHLWADKFDGALEDVFDLQDQVTQKVIGAIAPTIERAEMERTRTRATERLDAYDHFIRGLTAAVEYNRESTETALRHFREAIKIDPQYAASHARIAMATVTKRQNGWFDDEAKETRIGIEHARKAVQLAGSDAVALADGAMALTNLADEVEQGTALVERALELNSNSSVVWFRSGMIKLFSGNFDVSLEHMEQAVRLSPLDPQMPQLVLANAFVHFCQGDYSTALSTAGRLVQERPGFIPALRIIAASAAYLGDLNLAGQTANQMLALDPSQSVARVSNATRYATRSRASVSLRAFVLRGFPNDPHAPPRCHPRCRHGKLRHAD